MVEVQGGELSNPILAGYITGFIRSVIGECLHNISTLKGEVISATTDGFITNIENLESKILDLPEKSTILFRTFRKIVSELSAGTIENCLELKNTETDGMIS
jgi:hypothetical protein